MKRGDFIRYLKLHGCELHREGSGHTIYSHTTSPLHRKRHLHPGSGRVAFVIAKVDSSYLKFSGIAVFI